MAVPAFKLPDGINFRTESELPLPRLSQCLCHVASFLQWIVGHAPLRRFDDWLEHDGLQFQVERAQVDVHGLFQLVGSISRSTKRRQAMITSTWVLPRST